MYMAEGCIKSAESALSHKIRARLVFLISVSCSNQIKNNIVNFLMKLKMNFK